MENKEVMDYFNSRLDKSYRIWSNENKIYIIRNDKSNLGDFSIPYTAIKNYPIYHKDVLGIVNVFNFSVNCEITDYTYRLKQNYIRLSISEPCSDESLLTIYVITGKEDDLHIFTVSDKITENTLDIYTQMLLLKDL